MTKLVIIIFLAVLGVLAYFNQGTVDLTIWKDITHSIPVIALILGATGVSIIFMLIIYSIRDARRYFDHWQIQRQQKKELKIQETYAKGLEAFYASRHKEAAEHFRQVTESNPTHVNALLRLGDTSYIEGEHEEAKAFYLKAKEVKPRSIEVLLSLANVAESEHKWPEALKCLDSILEIDDENSRILVRKREIYETNRNWNELIEIQTKILKGKLSPEEEEAENKRLTGYKYELACQGIENGDSDKAIKSLKAIMKSDENFTSAYLALADAYMKGGNTSDAKNILLKGYETTESMVILARLEDFYIEQGEPGSIIDIYQKSLQKDPKNVKLRFFLAKLYYRLEMIDHVSETVNAIDPSVLYIPGMHALLGSVYERRSEKEKAIDEYKKALKMDKPIVVPYICSECDFEPTEWSGRCPECDNWNSFILDINEARETQKRQSSS